MGSSRSFSTSSLMELVSHVTEAAIHAEHWTAFLETLEGHFPDTRMMLFGHENGRPSSSLSFTMNFPEEDQRAYAEHYVRTSPYVLRGLERLEVGRARLSEAVISVAELETTEYYNDFARPRGLGNYAAGVIIERSAKRSIALSLCDHRDDTDRRDQQLWLLDILTPHIERAFRLHNLLDRERVQAEAAVSVFESWAHAALVLAADGRVLTMNRAAEELIASRNGILLTRAGRLRAGAEIANAALDQAIFHCAAQLPAEGLALPRLHGSPLNALLSPLPSGAQIGDAQGGSVLLVLSDPDALHRAPIDWMIERYGLAPAEARLAELLVNGDALAEAADQLGIRVSTARTRLKAIQAKTGCHRQADLVRLALSMPSLRASA